MMEHIPGNDRKTSEREQGMPRFIPGDDQKAADELEPHGGINQQREHLIRAAERGIVAGHVGLHSRGVKKLILTEREKDCGDEYPRHQDQGTHNGVVAQDGGKDTSIGIARSR